MRNPNVLRAEKYLTRFDQILSEMSNKMLSTRLTNNITVDFIKTMVPHHQAAIYMSENLLQYTRLEPLRKIARNIIEMQTKGINEMQEIERTTSGFPNSMQNVKDYITRYLEITKDMIRKMKNSPRNVNINLNFVGEMIPHHEGAIAMCQNLLQYNIDTRLRTVANNIVKEQSEGVQQLKKIQRMIYR